MKDVVISMKSVHGLDMDQQDTVNFTTDGYFFKDGDTFCFSYMESEVTGLVGTRTSVIVRPGEVVVDRDGNITSRMVFREGMRNSFLYSTPFGTATMDIDTKRIHHSFDENGGQLEVDYVLGMEHSMVMRNKLRLKVKEQINDNFMPN